MSSIWFTADSHFGHKNIVRACSTWNDKAMCRDFASIEEHDTYLIDQLNRRIRPCDTLFHLGDFGFGFAWRNSLLEFRARIKCERIILVIGNHDHIFEPEENVVERSIFAKVKHLHYGKISNRHFVLCHYAMRTWPWRHFGAIHLYGHSHGNLPDDPNSFSLDVGVDTSLFGHERYTPYGLEEVVGIVEQHKRLVPIDHHKNEAEKS